MTTNAIIKTALFTPGLNGRWGLPLLMEAEPGTGKTARLKSLGLGLEAIVMVGSLRDAADIGGVMTLVDGVARLALPEWADRARKLGRCVVVMDELTTAAPSVQAAMLRVVNEGVVGDTELPPGVRFLAACNSVDDAAGGYDIAPPMANRFGHLPWDAGTAADWADWLVAYNETAEAPEADAASIEANVLARWPDAWATARATVATFIRGRGDSLLHRKPSSSSPGASKAWPSRRTWELATRALAGAAVHGLSVEDTDTLLAAFVGAGPAAELRAWLAANDLPDPAAVLDGGATFHHNPQRADRTHAVLMGAAAVMAGTPAPDKQRARALAFWRLVDTVIGQQGADLCILPAGLAIKTNVERTTALGVLNKLTPVMQAAGMTGGK